MDDNDLRLVQKKERKKERKIERKKERKKEPSHGEADGKWRRRKGKTRRSQKRSAS